MWVSCTIATSNLEGYGFIAAHEATLKSEQKKGDRKGDQAKEGLVLTLSSRAHY